MTSNPEAEMAWPEIQNNAQVRHPRFGVGKVVMRMGTDEKSKAIVKFKEEGEKKLALRFANLTVDRVDDEEPGAPKPEGA